MGDTSPSEYLYVVMEQPKDLETLIEKYLQGNATPEEKEILNRWYHSFDDEEVVVEEADANESKLKLAIQQRLLQTTGIRKKIPVQRHFARIAAAILLLLGGFSIYYFLTSKKETQITQKIQVPPVPAPILPGGEKAVLTLADGSTIILDSAANGLLSNQGTMKVEKLKNGELSYTVNGKKITEKDEAFYNTISTPRGGQYHVTLSDGTEVWLNAASSIRFPVAFIGNERKVTVTGETYFEVAKDAAKPFKVKTEKEQVEVLGTHFNINAYADEPMVKTTLLEGKVKVMSDGMQAAFLLPGQQSGISANGNITIANDADLEEAVAWKNGRFQFNSADLKTILRQVSRWYDVDIEYRSKVDLHFTGQLTRDSDVSKVFEKLALAGEVHFKTEGRKIIVTK